MRRMTATFAGFGPARPGYTSPMFKRRYALLGFLTWMLGKRFARRKLHKVARSLTSATSRS
jgi:hypothetical protein